MIDSDITLAPQFFAHDGGNPVALLGLTILWHPDTERIGEQFIGPSEAGTIELSRYSPLFFRPGQEPVPLGHRAIARAPLQIHRTAGDGVDIAAPESRMSLEVNGQLLGGAIHLDRQEIDRGVVIGLGGHVLLCLHWMSGLPKNNALPGLLGVSSGAIATRDLIRQVAGTELSVLLLGETGTGKDVAARAIHSAGRRSALPLVAVNMATLNESLAAADLFGAVKGAYTGAQAPRQGLFAEADGGTLFLDELGDTPVSVQPMLLRVLDGGDYRPLGAARALQSRARLVAATDQSLGEGSFNQPLLRRLEAFVIRLPALRERREDIGLLVLHALDEWMAGSGGDAAVTLPVSLVGQLCRHDWPGNVRQLVHVVRRALLALQAGTAPAFAALTSAQAQQAKEVQDAQEGQAAQEAQAAPRRVDLAGVDPAAVMAAMDSGGWQIRAGAAALGVSRPSMYKLLEAHPLIRAAAAIPRAELQLALASHGNDVARCAVALKTPSEALRRHLRGEGLLD